MDGVGLIAGVLLLVNRYVPLALVTLAAVLANILTFHLTMALGGIFPALVLTGCWFVVAYGHRATLLPLLAPRPPSI